MRFTSKSEKKYWYYTLVVLIGIIGSIFLGRPLIDALPQHFASMGFAAVLWSVLGIIVLHGLVTKKHILEIALWIGIFSVYFLIVLRMTSEEERSHMIEFSILAICIYAALKERHQHAVLKYHPAIIAFAISVIIGALDEFIQLFVPGRVFDWIDIGFNSFAAFFAIAASTALSWVRSKLIKAF